MAERIGLEATLDMDSFHKGMSQYLGGLDKMNSKTDSFAGAATKHFQSFGKSVLGATAVMGGAMVAAAAGAGIAIGKFTIDGIKAAADLESRMSGIAAVLNLTTEQAKPLKTLIMDLAINPNLKVDAEGAADAIENLARNGVPAKDIIDGMAESVILLANATGAEFGPAADVVTDIMGQFKLEVKDAGDIINGVVGVTNASKMSFDDYRLAIGQAGGVVGSMKVSLDDFNAALVTTAHMFNSGSDAGTSFKSFMGSLIPTTKEQKEAFAALDLEFYDANGQMKDLDAIGRELNETLFQEVTFTKQVNNMTAEQVMQKKVLEQTIANTNRELYKYSVNINGTAQSEADKIVSIDRLNRKHDAAIAGYEGLASAMGTTVTITRKLTDLERNRFVELGFGMDGQRTAIGLAEGGAIAYENAADAARELGVSEAFANEMMKDGVITVFEMNKLMVKNADAVFQAKTRNDNFKASFQILRDAIAGVQLMIGDKFLPVLRKFTEWATTWVSANSPAIIAAFESFATAISTFINTLAIGQSPMTSFFYAMAAFGGQGLIIASIVSNIVTNIQDFIAVTVAALSPITTLISSFVSWNDVLVVLGLAVGSVVIPAIWGMIASLTPVIAVVGAVLLAVSALRMVWEGDFTAMQLMVTNLSTYIITNLPVWQATLRLWGRAAYQWIAGAIPIIKTKLGEWKDAVIGWVDSNREGWIGSLNYWASAAWQWVVDAAGQVGAKLSEWWTIIFDYITVMLPIWEAKLYEWGDAGSNWLTTAITKLPAKLAKWWTILSNHVTKNWPLWKAKLLEWGNAAWQWIAEAMPITTAKLYEWWAAIQTYVTENLLLWKAKLAEWGDAAWGWLTTAISQLPTKLGEWWTALTTYVDENLPTWKEKLGEWATAAWQWIVAAAGTAASKLSDWWTIISGHVTVMLPVWKTKLGEWGVIAWNWLVEAKNQALVKIGEWWIALKTYVTDNLPLWKAKLIEWALVAWEWIVDAKNKAVAKLGEWWEALKAYVIENLPVWKAKLLEWGNAAWEWIVEAVGIAVGKLSDWWTGISNYVTVMLPIWKEKFKGWGAAAWEWIVEAKDKVKEKFDEWWGVIEPYISEKLPIFNQKLVEWRDVIIAVAGVITASLVPALLAIIVPAALVVAAVMALSVVSALVRTAWDKNWGGIQEKTKAVADAIKPVIEGIKTGVDSFLKSLGEGKTVSESFSAAMTAMLNSPGFKGVKDTLQTIRDRINDVNTKVTEFVNNVKGWVDKVVEFNDGFVQLKDALLVLSGVILASLVPSILAAALSFGALTLAAAPWIALVGGLILIVATLRNAWEKDWMSIRTEFSAMVGILTAAAAPLAGVFASLILAVAVLRKAWTDDWGGIRTKTEASIKAINESIESTKTAWESAKTSYFKWDATLVANVADFQQKIIEWREGVVGKVTGINWQTIGENIMTDIKTGLFAIAPNALTLMGGIVKLLVEKVTEIDWWQIGSDIVQGIIDGIEAMKAEFIRRALAIFDALPDAVKNLFLSDSPSKLFMAIGEDVVEGFILGLESMKDVKSVFDGLMNSIKSFSKIANTEKYSGFIAELEITNQFLNAQIDLLDQLEKSGIDPRAILDGVKLGIDADPDALAFSITGLLKAAQNQIGEGLFRRQTGLIAKAVIKPLTDLLSTQSERLASFISNTIEEFGKLRIDRVVKKISDLDTQIKAYTDSGTPLSAGEQSRLATMIEQRALLISQVADVNRLENSLGIAQGKENISLMEKQISILQQAKELGVDVSSSAFGNVGDDSTLRALTMTVASIQQTQAAQLRKQIDLLKQGESPESKRLTLLENQRAALDGQVSLLKEMQALGINFTGALTPEAMQQAAIQVSQAKLQQVLLELKALQSGSGANQTKKAQADQIAQLGEQTSFITEQLALFKEMQDLQLNTAGIFGANASREALQKAAILVAQVKLQQIIGELRKAQTDSVADRARKAQENQLTLLTDQNAFITEQLSLLKEMQALGLNASGIFGPGATREALTQASILIAQVKLQRSLADLRNAQTGQATNSIRKAQEDRLALLTEQTTALENQLSIMDDLKRLGLSMPNFFGPNATIEQIQSQMIRVSEAEYQGFIKEFAARRTKELAEAQLKPYIDWMKSQTAALDRELGMTVSDFGKLQIDRLVTQLEDLDKQIANYTNNPHPIGNALNAAQIELGDLIYRRSNLINEIDRVSDIEDIFNIEGERNAIDLMNKQVALLTQAKALGVSLPPNAFGDMANMDTLRSLTMVLANIQHTQAYQLKQQLAGLRAPDNWQVKRLETLQKQQAALDEQVTLLQKVKSLGLQLSGEYDFGLGMTQGDLNNLAIRAGDTQLRRTMNELALLERLSPELLNPQATGTVAQLYKAQVLDPMLKTLREAVMLESDRVALIEQYKQKALELAKIETKQRQLDFLMMQNDLLNQLDDEFPKAVELQILSGLKLGLNASLDDLLILAGRMVDAFIKKTKDDMGIGSPSKVFMRIGQNVMAGFSRGINSMAAQPIQAFQQALRPLPYAMSGRALSMNMGGVTINNGMDEVMFEARVRQVVEGLI